MQASKTRDNKIKEQYKTMTLREIGKLHGITGERVRQLLKKQGISFENGRYAHVKKLSQERFKRLQKESDIKAIKYYGVTRDKLTAIPKKDLTEVKLAFRQLKRNARRLDLTVEINIIQYWKIWEKSGKFNQRGQKSNQYRLIRKDFKKGYVKGNLKIEQSKESMRRVVRWRDSKK